MTKWTIEACDWYAEKYGAYATNRLGIEALDLQPDSNVVDIGPGTGEALRHASVRVTSGALVGVDPLPRMLEIAKEWCAEHPARDRFDFRLGHAKALPVDDDFADFVIAFDTFDHWTDHAAGMAEVRRVLRSGGTFAALKDASVPQHDGSCVAFRAACEAAGFVIDEERRVDDEVTFTFWRCHPA